MKQRNAVTHRKADECLAGRLVVVDDTDTAHATRVVVEKPEGLILVLYGDSESGTSGARLSVPEARIETVDGAIRVVCRDAGVAKR